MKILITGIGGPTPRSIAVALKSYILGNNYELIGTDCNRLAIGLYQNHLFKKTYFVPAATSSVYWPVIEKIIANEKIDIAFVQPEQEVLIWSQRAKKYELPCKALIPDLDLAKTIFDKYLLNKTLAPLGIVPKSVKISRDQNSSSIEKEINYPFWVRSISGSSGLGSFMVTSPTKFKSWININPEIKNFLISKYLPGRNLVCKMLYFKGKLIRSACGQRINYIMAKVSPSGITGNTSFGKLINDRKAFNVSKEALDNLFEKFKLKKHGFFSVDLKEDSGGNPLITEINLRHIAFTSCFAAVGANFVEDTIRLLLDDKKFDKKFKHYKFQKNWLFLRDVDAKPIVIEENELL